MNLFDLIMKKNEKQLSNHAVVCNGKCFTYYELDEYVKSISELLKNCGIRKGCKVALIVSKPLDFIVLFLSMILCDGIIVPIYENTGIKKTLELIEKFHIEYLITSDTNFIKYSEYEGIMELVVNENGYRVLYTKSTIEYEELYNVILILLTSGTTNIPKGVMLTADNITSNIESISKYLNLKPNERVLLIKNLCHASSIVGEFLVALFNGCCLVLTVQLPLASNILKTIEQEKISIFFAVPTILKQMMEYKKINDYDFTNLRIINFYGSKMPYQDILKLIQIFKNTNLIYSYGLTEASPRVTYIEREDLLNKLASSGRPIDNVKVKIFDSDGKEIESYEKGEIIVEGPNVMLGYYQNDLLTKNTIRNGLLHTGDLGYLDEDGYLYVTGRIDNMIIISGKNIQPEEIEGVLSTFPDILEALVTENEESQLIAYIVTKDNKKLEIIDVLKYCKERLEDYKIPKEIIIIEKFEKTVSGKVKRVKYISK
ncbi:MAG: acyl--CoA ligase [Clostridia bacterium]|nr:acyl--CoA ligase [Clostridia bacterium]